MVSQCSPVDHRLIKVGTSSQRWHFDIGGRKVNRYANTYRRGWHGFFFLWQLEGERAIEYCDSQMAVEVLRLLPGQLATFSFDVPHRGLATLDTIGSIALHGYCIHRSLDVTSLNYPTRLRANPDCCSLCAQTYFDVQLMPCGCLLHQACALQRILGHGDLICYQCNRLWDISPIIEPLAREFDNLYIVFKMDYVKAPFSAWDEEYIKNHSRILKGLLRSQAGEVLDNRLPVHYDRAQRGPIDTSLDPPAILGYHFEHQRGYGQFTLSYPWQASAFKSAGFNLSHVRALQPFTCASHTFPGKGNTSSVQTMPVEVVESLYIKRPWKPPR